MTSQILLAVANYINAGKVIYPVKNNDKIPDIKNWTGVTKETIPKFKTNNNIGILCGEINQIFVIDVDHPKNDELNGIKWFENMEAVHGPINTTETLTRSDGRHLYFRWHPILSQFKPRSRVIKDDDGNTYSIDIRTTGSGVLVPPSTINNKRYTWVRELNDANLKEMPIWLLKEISKTYIDSTKSLASSKNIITEDIPELLKVLSYAAENLDIEYATNYTKWINFLMVCAKYIQDFPKYENQINQIAHNFSMRAINYDCDSVDVQLSYLACRAIVLDINTVHSWLRNSNPLSLVGFTSTVISKIEPKTWDDFVKTLAKSQFKEHFLKYAPQFSIYIERPSTYIIFSEKGREIIDSTAIKENSLDREVTLKKHNKHGEITKKKLQLTDVIKQFGKQYIWSKFNTTNATLPNEYNEFEGLLTQKSSDPIDTNMIQPILDHLLKILCDNETHTYNYIIKWLSQMFEGNVDKTLTALAFSGPPGCGKGLFWSDLIINKIIGTRYAGRVRTIHDIAGRFNKPLFNTHLVLIEEADNVEIRQYSTVLKNIITAPSIICEHKGKEGIEKPSHCALVMLSNQDNLLTLDNQDRRYTCIETSKQIPPAEYFNTLIPLIKNPICAQHLYNYIITQAQTINIDVTKPPPTAQRTKNLLSCDEVATYLREKLSFESTEIIIEQTSTQWFKDYAESYHECKTHSIFKPRLLNWTASCTKHNTTYYTLSREIFTKLVQKNFNLPQPPTDLF